MTLLVADPDFTLHLGDVREVLAELPDESVHCVVTSPPYWGLRDYAVAGQLGLEPTPDQYIHNMVAVFREVRRVLRRDGTLWLNIGDSYNSASQFNHDKSGLGDASRYSEGRGDNWPGHRSLIAGLKPKDLCGIPWRLAFALQQDGWYLRAEIIWAKPNPMPESVTDRPTKAHEQVFLLTRSPRYFYDADAVREPHQWQHVGSYRLGADSKNGGSVENPVSGRGNTTGSFRGFAEGGRNLRSVWEIPTEPFPQAHFATYPQALVERCVKAGTSEHGCCPECGAPWERETAVTYVPLGDAATQNAEKYAEAARADKAISRGPQSMTHGRAEKRTETLGWRPTCACHERSRAGVDYDAVLPPVPCTVLDPFIGSGTTALVARRLGRKCVGIELSSEYAQICLDRTRQLSLLAT